MAENGKKFIIIDNKRIKIDDIESYEIYTEVLKFEKVYTNEGGFFSQFNPNLVWNGEKILINEKRYNDLKCKNHIDRGFDPAHEPWFDHTTYKQVYDSHGDIVDSNKLYPNHVGELFATRDDVIEKESQCLHIITSQKEYWFSEYFMDDFEEKCNELDTILA